jgi:hypothetical protein
MGTKEFRFRVKKNSMLYHRLMRLCECEEFAETARRALELWFALEAGKLEVLRKHFPEEVTPDVYEKLEGLERSIKNMQTIPVQSNGNARQIEAPQFEVPNYDDDDDMFDSQKIEGHEQDVAVNFLNSLHNLQQ